MFQFPGFALINLCIQSISTCFSFVLIAEQTIWNCQVGCPIQKSMDQSLFSAPHGLSQSITSFIASYCQGIHQTPFSRLIWSRKSKTCVKRGTQLVTKGAILLNQKHTFPRYDARAPYLLQSDVGGSRSIRQATYLIVQLALNLVSVLDLDNSVRFSWQTFKRPRKQSQKMLAFKPRSPLRITMEAQKHQAEIIATLGAIKQRWLLL